MNHKFSYLKGSVISAATATLLFASCGEAQFKIKGEIAGADNQPVLLEKSDFHGRWIAIDSTRTSSSGAFTISRPAPAAPEVFRLVLNDRFIYLPIDSVETVNVTTSEADFGTKYTLSGSEKAEAMMRFDQEVMTLPSDIAPDSLDAFKKKVYANYIMNGPGSVVSYYVLTKTIGDKPLFSPDTDTKYFAAVATGFKQMRPNDPRTALLEKTSIDALKKNGMVRGKQIELQAQEVTVLEIELPDENGKNVKLSSMVGKGKPVVVLFSLLTHPDSPAHNLELSKIYNGGNVDFYQVSLDPDQYAWREAARNLPWTTVFEPDGEYSKALRQYNVSEIPTYFIYDRTGTLTARASDSAELRKALSGL